MAKFKKRQMSGITSVFDVGSGEELVEIQGIAPVPIGTELVIEEAQVRARVVRIRLRLGTTANLCLDVELIR
jgi:hypothetical protein